MTAAMFRKAFVAIGAAAGVAAAALADGSFDTNEIIGVILAFLGAYGVYRVPNAPAA
jgi:hypothetical protein